MYMQKYVNSTPWHSSQTMQVQDPLLAQEPLDDETAAELAKAVRRSALVQTAQAAPAHRSPDQRGRGHVSAFLLCSQFELLVNSLSAKSLGLSMQDMFLPCMLRFTEAGVF